MEIEQAAIRVEHVFTINGVPTYTFVEPKEYAKLLVSMRTPGRGVIVEGPSGIGKTSAVETVIKKLNLNTAVTKLSARKKQDVEYIAALPELGDVGLVIVDDFHKLPDETKTALADFIKTLADEGSDKTKVVIIGINKAGERLISFAPDLVNRIDIIKFENNPEHKVRELIQKGEAALNVKINVDDEIIEASQGSFYVAQLLCLEVCLKAEVLARSSEKKTTAVSFEGVRANVWDRLSIRFKPICKTFCQGSKMKREGRAPYLHILNWLASSDWSLSLPDAIRKNSELRGSVSQVVEKGFLEELISKDDIRDVLHYDPKAKLLTVEDPQFIFFLKYIPWSTFAKEVGFISVEFKNRYDFALSFAGSDRAIAEAIFEKLSDHEVEVFYDRNEEYRIIGNDVEEYLRPIYQTEARYVVCLLGAEYPKRIWTRVESEAFRNRFTDGAIIPIFFDEVAETIFDPTRRVGGLTFQRDKNSSEQVEKIASALIRKLGETRGVD